MTSRVIEVKVTSASDSAVGSRTIPVVVETVNAGGQVKATDRYAVPLNSSTPVAIEGGPKTTVRATAEGVTGTAQADAGTVLIELP